jgi:hypothetical protein
MSTLGETDCRNISEISYGQPMAAPHSGWLTREPPLKLHVTILAPLLQKPPLAKDSIAFFLNQPTYLWSRQPRHQSFFIADIHRYIFTLNQATWIFSPSLFRAFSVPNYQSATMPSAQDIASKLAQISAQLNAGGTNAQMKQWYDEYKQLVEELKAAKVMQTTAPKTTCHGNPDDT